LGDILSQGEDRRRPSWPRLLALAAALTAVAAVLIAEYLPRHHAPAAAGRTARTGAASGPARGPQPRAGSAISVTGLPGQPNGITGPVLHWDSGFRLPVTGSRPGWYYPASGQRSMIGGLPRDRAGYQFTRIGGGWAIQPGAPSPAGCGGCTGPPRPVYTLADQDQAARKIAAADQVAPGAAAGTLWLTSYPAGADPATAAGAARAVSAAGASLGPAVTLPSGYVIVRQTSRGLLLAPALQRTGRTADRLWDPGRRSFSRGFGTVIAASATKIAWVTPCARACRAHVLDLATGRAAVIRLPAGSSAANGALSPDGDYLALQVSVGSGGNGGALAMQLEVASLASGQLTLVPGTWASSDALVGFGWPAGRDSLVAELSFTTKVQVTSWQPGAARLAVAVVSPGQSAGTLVVG
jgi:hypothetical protein